MSIVYTGTPYGFDSVALSYKAQGRPTLPYSVTVVTPFTLGTTEPSATNTGRAAIPDAPALRDYPGIALTLSINVDTPTIFEDYNFGTTRVVVRCPGVRFSRCRWRITNNSTISPIINVDNANVSNCVIEYCDLENVDQMGYQFNAIQGHDFLAYRNNIRGTVDGIRPNNVAAGPGNAKIHGNFIHDLAWFGTETGKVTLNSGFQTHSDCIQTTCAGVEVIGNSLWAHPSRVVGTGTPGSGTDSGNPNGWYTQAQAELRRSQLLGTSFTVAADSPDGISHENGGALCCLMNNIANGSTSPNILVRYNWFAGGNVHVDGLATNLTSPLGTFEYNRHYNDSHSRVLGHSNGYYFRSTLTAVVPQTGPAVNTYMNDGTVVPRKDQVG